MIQNPSTSKMDNLVLIVETIVSSKLLRSKIIIELSQISQSDKKLSNLGIKFKLPTALCPTRKRSFTEDAISIYTNSYSDSVFLFIWNYHRFPVKFSKSAINPNEVIFKWKTWGLKQCFRMVPKTSRVFRCEIPTADLLTIDFPDY